MIGVCKNKNDFLGEVVVVLMTFPDHEEIIPEPEPMFWDAIDAMIRDAKRHAEEGR